MLTRVQTTLLAACLAALCLLVPGTALAQSTGGAAYQPPAGKAKVRNGKAIAPADAPPAVKKLIAAANRIVTKPYKYGGGHAKVEDTGYDCSGTVSYALIKAGLLTGTPLDSTGFMGWGEEGKGKWITVYAHGGHAYVVIAGLRFDTSSAGASGGNQDGPRWWKEKASTKRYEARHPSGL